MPTARSQRIFMLLWIIIGISIAIILAILALKQNMNFFYTPIQVSNGEAPLNTVIKVGGIVVTDSLKRNQHNLKVSFEISDYQAKLPIVYEGILPDLFRENSGIIASGVLTKEGHIIAKQILAKHDETYMPAEVNKIIKNWHKNSTYSVQGINP